MKKIVNLGFTFLLFLICVTGSFASDQHQHGSHGSSAGDVERVSVEQVQQRLQQGEAVLFVDTRADAAWSSSDYKIPDAIRVKNNGQLRKLVEEVGKETFIVAYCT